jgi:hypothetical protein
MLWQAEAGFGFRLVGGHFGLRVTPSEEEWRDVYDRLGTGSISPRRLRAFLEAHDVDVVIVAAGTHTRVRRAVAAAVGAPPERVRDVLVYRIDLEPGVARQLPDGQRTIRVVPADCSGNRLSAHSC